MMVGEKPYAGWPSEVLDVLEEGIGVLEDIPNRLVGDLEIEGILTIEDLLKQTPTYLRKAATLGNKSWDKLIAALRSKGFKRRLFCKEDPNRPLYEMFEGCMPSKKEPMDLLDETPTVHQDLSLLGYQDVVIRAVEQLDELLSYRNFDDSEEEQPSYDELSVLLHNLFKQIEWIVYYMENREIEPPPPPSEKKEEKDATTGTAKRSDNEIRAESGN